MKLKATTLGLGALLLVLAAGAVLQLSGEPAEANVNRAIIGLWRGIDPVDGSQVMRVFAPVPDSGGQTQLLFGHDTAITTCTSDNDPFEVGNDKATILGEVKVGNQVGAVLTLTGDVTIDCFAPGAPGPVDLGLHLELDRSTGALSETLLDPETREPAGRPAIVFYQVDTQDRVDVSASGALIGLWEGVDRSDGSETLRQFLPSSHGSDYRTILANDTLFGLCTDPANPNDLGNDKALATGDLELIQSDAGLIAFEGLVTLTCFTPGAPPPTEFGARYELYPDIGMVVETILDPVTRESIGRFPTFNFQISDLR